MRIPKTPLLEMAPSPALAALVTVAVGLAAAACGDSEAGAEQRDATVSASEAPSNDAPSGTSGLPSPETANSPQNSGPTPGPAATPNSPSNDSPTPIGPPAPATMEPGSTGGETTDPSTAGAGGTVASNSAGGGGTEPTDSGSGGLAAGGGGPPPGSGGQAGGAGGTIAAAGGGGAAGEASAGGSGGVPVSGDPFGPDVEGNCTESQAAQANASGSGPHDVVVETNSDPGINEGTIFRPADLGGSEPYPIFVWGQGACSQDGLSNAAAMAEIASHGYFVVADGTPGGSGSRTMDSNNVPSMGEPLLAYVEWAITENAKPCSAYYHSLDMTKVAANGFSCGGLMSTGTAGDPRITTWGSTSSGTFSENRAFYESVHTPVLIIEGGPSDIAYENGARDYENISELGHPIMWFSKDIGHGGDLFSQGGGDFTRINLAWLNWWLKGDEGETGKGVLVGGGCSYCTDPQWDVKSANLP